MVIAQLKESLMESMKVMIIEDEIDICDLFADYLEMRGCEKIFKVSTGKDAIAKIEQEKPDIIFLDIQLADNINGLEVLKKTREISPGTKVIMMSAYKEEYGEQTQELGAYGFLKKPFRADDLSKMLDKVFKDKEGEA